MSCRHQRRARPNSNRTGAVLFAVIVGLAIASAIWFALVKTAVIERRVVREQQWRLQADELAVSALERAAAQLAIDRKYEGEKWLVPADALDGRHAAAVAIEIIADEERPHRRTIRVRASYPDQGAQRATETLETFVDLSAERNGS
jgi:hypothetical protein